MHYFLRNYRMNAKIHPFSIRLHVLGRPMQAQLPSFTFIALYSRRLCYNQRDPENFEFLIPADKKFKDFKVTRK